MPNPTDPYATTPQQLFSPEEYEKMKQRQAAAQAAATPPAQSPAPPAGPVAPITEPTPGQQAQGPLDQLGEWMKSLPPQFAEWLKSLMGGSAAPASDAIVEPQRVEEVPVNDPEGREVRTMEERAKKPLADTKGVISKKEKKE